jgi:hypothetical protein
LIASEQTAAQSTHERAGGTGQAAQIARIIATTARIFAGTQYRLRSAPPLAGLTMSGLAGQAESSTACSYNPAPASIEVVSKASRMMNIRNSNMPRYRELAIKIMGSNIQIYEEINQIKEVEAFDVSCAVRSVQPRQKRLAHFRYQVYMMYSKIRRCAL